MKDPGLEIRTAYWNLLDGLTVGAITVPAFDYMATFPEAVPYIILGETLNIAQNTKDTFGTECTVDILIYTAYNGDFGGRKLADQIANAVLAVAIPTPGMPGITTTSFNVTSAKLLGVSDELTRGDGKNTFLKRITIEHIIFEQ